MAKVIVSPRPWFVAKLQKYFGTVPLVEAGDDGLATGTVQEALQALATRVQALEDASAG